MTNPTYLYRHNPNLGRPVQIMPFKRQGNSKMKTDDDKDYEKIDTETPKKLFILDLEAKIHECSELLDQIPPQPKTEGSFISHGMWNLRYSDKFQVNGLTFAFLYALLRTIRERSAESIENLERMYSIFYQKFLPNKTISVLKKGQDFLHKAIELKLLPEELEGKLEAIRTRAPIEYSARLAKALGVDFRKGKTSACQQDIAEDEWVQIEGKLDIRDELPAVKHVFKEDKVSKDIPVWDDIKEEKKSENGESHTHPVKGGPEDFANFKSSFSRSRSNETENHDKDTDMNPKSKR